LSFVPMVTLLLACLFFSFCLSGFVRISDVWVPEHVKKYPRVGIFAKKDSPLGGGEAFLRVSMQLKLPMAPNMSARAPAMEFLLVHQDYVDFVGIAAGNNYKEYLCCTPSLYQSAKCNQLHQLVIDNYANIKKYLLLRFITTLSCNKILSNLARARNIQSILH